MARHDDISSLNRSERRPRRLGGLLGGLGNAFRYRSLLAELIQRDFIGRYRGSFLGIFWSFLNPALMLTVYTLVFSVAFKSRWSGYGEDQFGFALILFSGMIIHGFLAECLNRAPSLMLQNVNFVKKVIFPLDLLALVTVISALLHFAINFVVLIVFCLVLGFKIHAGAIWVPLILLPLILMVTGLTWFFSALGVYLKDLNQFVGFLVTISLFLSPVFYDSSALPLSYQAYLSWNPITLPVMEIRDVMLFGKPMAWMSWSISLGLGALMFFGGFAWFQRVRRGFADVL
jgi:lipopolysaccharide transport system permease protein